MIGIKDRQCACNIILWRFRIIFISTRLL